MVSSVCGSVCPSADDGFRSVKLSTPPPISWGGGGGGCWGGEGGGGGGVLGGGGGVGGGGGGLGGGVVWGGGCWFSAILPFLLFTRIIQYKFLQNRSTVER